MIGVYIPTYKRSHKLEKVFNNFAQSVLGGKTPVELVFILEKDDQESIYVCNRYAYKYVINERNGCYAACINQAYLTCDHKMFFCGADDLHFEPGWLDILMESRKNNPDKMVFGTRDFLNPLVDQCVTATHFLVDREYIKSQGGTIDGSFPVLYEYDHNYTDTEFIRTAIYRGVFQPCLDSVVRHDHDDRDYTTAKSLRNARGDAETFHSRMHLWHESLPL